MEELPPTNETTNAVLKEMIIGLTKITDERLGNLKDNVAEVKLLLSGFATKVEVLELKNDFYKSVEDIRKGAEQHNLDDKASFKAITDGQQAQKITLAKWSFAAIVIVALISFFSPLIYKFIFHIS